MQAEKSRDSIEFINKRAAEIQQSIVIDKSCYNEFQIKCLTYNIYNSYLKFI